MFSVRCVVLLALLACIQAREKCTRAKTGRQSGYKVRFATVSSALPSFDMQLPFWKAGCDDPVGSWVEVCVDDVGEPSVWFDDVENVSVQRDGPIGLARVRSGGFCGSPPHPQGLGAALAAPMLVPTKG